MRWVPLLIIHRKGLLPPGTHLRIQIFFKHHPSIIEISASASFYAMKDCKMPREGVGEVGIFFIYFVEVAKFP
jgi:hypothetical protein